jgi:Protein kinase domain
MVAVPRIGTEFAGYRIEALIGRGGMSVVYRAENTRLGNKVALKLLAEELAGDESFRERFVRESRTAASINHPNIVTIYDAGDWEGVLYIAMRHVDGDLKELLRRDGPLSIDTALAVLAQVGSALDAAHARGLLHRDVKPANILLDPPSEPDGLPHAYLADFGLTKHLESRSGITASGQFVGTIDYMSPEQIEGRDVDARTDVYSLGCVVFECLAGSTPFRRETEVAVLWAHMREAPPPVSELRPDLPVAVDDVIAKAVAKAPDDRYATCRELVDDLREALEGVSDRRTRGAPPPAVTARTEPSPRGKPPRRRLQNVFAWAGGALLVGVALGAGGQALFFKPDPEIIVPGTTGPQMDAQLLKYIPQPLRKSCAAAERLTLDFVSSIVCRPGGREIQRVEYNKAESGEKMRTHFEKRAIGEGLGTFGVQFQPQSHCGEPPALREWRSRGKAGHRPLEIGEAGADGRFLCFRQEGWAAVEWTDQGVDVYSAAYGRDLGRLFEWWKTKAGPIPAD